MNAEQYASLLMDKGQLCERHQRAIQDWLGNPSCLIDQLKDEPQTASQRLLRAIYDFSFAGDPKARAITQALREADDTIDSDWCPRCHGEKERGEKQCAGCTQGDEVCAALPWEQEVEVDDPPPPPYSDVELDAHRDREWERQWEDSEREQER